MSYNKDYIIKLRNSGLRPTNQRIRICEILFNTEKTFHFTIKDLAKMIENTENTKISLATIYNTVHAFNKKGYLKEIPINSSQSYFDTNISHHHHFFDEEEKKLIDLEDKDVGEIKINKTVPGKKIKSVEIIAKIETDK
jgi:Fur family iron response transcriptional regulator|tara:strand:+ start:795 stop:1211 length:417 start_codon:yes stop_codon:yes gene_type:complete